MILPVSHNEGVIRRWPVVTIVIIVINLLVLVFTEQSRSGVEREFVGRRTAAVSYLSDHPYLDAPAKLKMAARANRVTAPVPTSIGRRTFRTRKPRDPNVVQEEQQELDKLIKAMEDTVNQLPSRRFGFIPAKFSLVGLVAHMFMHGGIIHFLSNMWFLWLCACNLEDRWSRPVFGGFYAAAGIVAAITHTLFTWGSEIPMVGASGAVAGCMGAFMLTHGKAKIRMVMIVFFRVIPFEAPAYVMLPLWAAVEVLAGLAFGGRDMVAHWAHVGGFAFGAVVALAVKRTGFEERFTEKLETSEESAQPRELTMAAKQLELGNSQQALQILGEFVGRNPDNPDGHLELMAAAKQLGNTTLETQAYGDLIRINLADGRDTVARELYDEARRLGRDEEVKGTARVRLARHLEKQGNLSRASQELSALHGDYPENEIQMAALLAHAEIMIKRARRQAAMDLLILAPAEGPVRDRWQETLQSLFARAEALPEGHPFGGP